MIFKDFATELEECINNGYSDSLLCVMDEDGDEYCIDSVDIDNNDNLILYVGTDQDNDIQSIFEELDNLQIPSDSFVYVCFDEQESLYQIQGGCEVDDDDDIYFNVFLSEHESDSQMEIVREASNRTEEFSEFFQEGDEKKLDEKVSTFSSRLGVKAIYMAFWLYYALSAASASGKAMIIGALGYLICPVDIISDIIPIVGFTDDIAVITAAFVALSKAIDKADSNSISKQSKKKLKQYYPKFKESDLD